MKREDTFKGRFYEAPDGKRYPSVTTILSCVGKPALINWAAKIERELVLETSADLYCDCPTTPKMSRIAWLTTMGNRLGKSRAHQRQLAKAGDIGSQVHALIEWTLRARLCQEPGPSPSIDSDKAQWAFSCWQNWAKSVDLKPLAIEQVVYSETHGYAGTMDLLAEVNGKLTVLDWKTGKAIYHEAHLQNAAYRSALREMGHGDPEQGIIVRLPKVDTDPEFEAKAAHDEKESLQVFLSTMQLWKWTQKWDTWEPPKKVEEKTLEKQLEESVAQTNAA